MPYGRIAGLPKAASADEVELADLSSGRGSDGLLKRAAHPMAAFLQQWLDCRACLLDAECERGPRDSDWQLLSVILEHPSTVGLLGP